MIAALLSPPLSPRSDGKPEAVSAVVELLMMGLRTPEIC